MNERIKELYTEATNWALHNYPPPVNTFEWEDLRSKKFALLIVKECCDELRREWYELNAKTIDDAFADPRATGIHIGQKTGTIKCISRIKEHFGVEE